MWNGIWNQPYASDDHKGYREEASCDSGRGSSGFRLLGKTCDLIAASSEIAKQIVADVPVLPVTNLLDKKGIEELILPYMK